MGDLFQWIFATSYFTPVFWFHFEGDNIATVYQDLNQTYLYQAHVSHSFFLGSCGNAVILFQFWHRAL